MADRFATRLAQEVRKWVNDGLVSAEQGDRIVARYPFEQSWFSRPVALCCLIGGALIAGGVALVVSHNWEELHRWVKLGGLVALMLAGYAGGLAAGERGAPRAAEGFFVFGGVLALLGIALIGQIYNLSGRPSDAVLLWWLMLLPVAYTRPSLALGALAWLGVAAWYLMAITDSATLLGRGMAQQGHDYLMAFTALGLILFGVGGLHGGGAYGRWRQVLEHLGLLLLGSGLLMLGLRFFGWGGLASGGPSPTLVATLLVALVVIVLSGTRLPAGSLGLRLAFVAVEVVLLGYLAAYGLSATRWPWARDFPALTIANWFLMFAFSLALIVGGARWDRTSWINWGVVLIGLNAVARYLDLFGTMLQTSLLFFSAGAIVLLLGWLLERVRRRMTGRVLARREAG